jgi:hypothetical protein
VEIFRIPFYKGEKDVLVFENYSTEHALQIILCQSIESFVVDFHGYHLNEVIHVLHSLGEEGIITRVNFIINVKNSCPLL